MVRTQFSLCSVGTQRVTGDDGKALVPQQVHSLIDLVKAEDHHRVLLYALCQSVHVFHVDGMIGNQLQVN